MRTKITYTSENCYMEGKGEPYAIHYKVNHSEKPGFFCFDYFLNSKGEYHIRHIGEDGKEIESDYKEYIVPRQFYYDYSAKYGEVKTFEIFFLLNIDSLI